MAKTKDVVAERNAHLVAPAALIEDLADVNDVPEAEQAATDFLAERLAQSTRPGRKSPFVVVAAQIAADAVAITAALLLAYWWRFDSDIAPFYTSRSISTYILMLVITVLTLLVVFNVSGLYNLRRGTSRVDEFYKISQGVSMGAVGAIAVSSVVMGDAFVYSRLILVAGWLLSILLVTADRVLFGYVIGVLRSRGVSQQNVLLVGMGEPANNIIERMRTHPEYGYRVSGVLRLDGVDEPRKVFGPPILGTVEDVARVSSELRIDEVIVAVSGASHSALLDIISRCAQANVSIRIYPDAFQLITEQEVNVNDLGGLPLLSVKDVALRGWNRTLKRGFDIVASAVGLILVSPLLLIVALAIKLDSSGPVFFIQERVGLDGKTIDVIKFRSMRVDAGNQPGWTTANDPRRTRVGQWIRRFSIDELPQLINVLLGEMSIVGPRPEQPFFVQRFSRMIPNYMRRHTEKAGITGWAQINGMRGDTSIEERTRYDLYYVENWSLLLDLKIIVRTLARLVKGDAY